MPKTKILCICGSTDKPQKHHIFRKGLRKKWERMGLKNIMMCWSKSKYSKAKISTIPIPIFAYVRICPRCHRLAHPENLGFHLNELVVNHIEQQNG